MASITKVEIWEDIAGNVIGLVFDHAGQLTNAVQNLGAQQPLPRPALVEAARQAFPFAPTYDRTRSGEGLLLTCMFTYRHTIITSRIFYRKRPRRFSRNVRPLPGCSSLFAGCSERG